MNRAFALLAFVAILGLTFVEIGGAAKADKDDDGDNEQEVSVAQLPAPIKRALKDIKIGQLAEVEREKDGKGKVIYEVELRVGKHEVELKLGADGKLLGVEIEGADDDDDDDDRPKARRSRKKRDRDD